ncbi:hypothetical protein QBC39DRAFT_368080 [Podospora conica]|nr:hypothetical protein QBC39DRAFT_368080 [Schizothecium conicum]
MADTTKFRTDRADSTASTASTTSSASSSASPPSTGASAAMPMPTSPIGRRSSHGLFEGLTAQKRKDDPVSIARRQSLSDQHPKPGIIGKMWNKCVPPPSLPPSWWLVADR